jgi:Domain of unknown function (DUF6894)
MPRYFQHVTDGSTLSTDRHGDDLPDDQAACRHAWNRVREIVRRNRTSQRGHRLRGGEVVVMDDAGRLVISLTFSGQPAAVFRN